MFPRQRGTLAVVSEPRRAAGFTRAAVIAVLLAATAVRVDAQHFRGDPPTFSELALALTYGTTASYDTTVTSMGANGWVTWNPNLWTIGGFGVNALVHVELGWGKLSRPLPYNASDTHGPLVYGLGGGLSREFDNELELGAHLYHQVETNVDYTDYQTDAVEQFTLRLSGRRDAWSGRVSFPIAGRDESIETGTGRLTEIALWRERRGGKPVGLRYQRYTGKSGPETVTFFSLMLGVPR